MKKTSLKSFTLKKRTLFKYASSKSKASSPITDPTGDPTATTIMTTSY